MSTDFMKPKFKIVLIINRVIFKYLSIGKQFSIGNLRVYTRFHLSPNVKLWVEFFDIADFYASGELFVIYNREA